MYFIINKDIKYPYEFYDNCFMKNENMENIKVSNEQVVIRKLSKNKVNNKINFYHGYDNDYASTEDDDDDCPFGPLFKLYRFAGLSFLGRESLDDSTKTKTWLLTLEILSFLISILTTLYWIIILLIDPDNELMNQSTVGRIVLPAFMFNILLISCLCRTTVNYGLNRMYKIQLLLFELVDDKESVFRKLKKVVKNIIIISSLFLLLPFIDGLSNLFIAIKNNPNDSCIILSTKFFLFVYNAFTSK